MKICTACGQRFDGGDWTCPHCAWSPRAHNGHLLLAEHENGVEGYKGEFFSPLAEIEDGHFWFEARNRLIVWALRRYFPQMRSFLEIGCGTGFVLAAVSRAFSQTQLAGAEYYAEGLSFAQKRVPQADFYQLDARAMPFEAEFDVIGAFDVIEHIKEDEQVLTGMYRAVKPGGGLALTVPQHHFLWSVADQYKHHERRYERAELVEKVTRAGFKVAYTTSFVSLLLPMMLLSRLRQSRAKEIPDRMTELKINRLTNSVLNSVMRVETAFIQNRLRFPAGGSLLLIARKD